MNIGKGKIVTISYLLKNGAGEELDKADAKEPLVYLHGMGQLVPGLEKELDGLKAGDKKAKLEIAPEEAYGDMREDLRLTVKRSQFPADAEVQPGMRFWANTDDGNQHPFTVTGVTDEEVEIDGNHPLAGETLFFDIEVHGVRDATKEEMEHGHAHGEGGHQH